MSRRGDVNWTPELKARLKAMVDQGISDSRIGHDMGVSKGCISGARTRFGIKSTVVLHSVKRPPADFLEVGPTLTLQGCARHYGASPSTAKAWYELLDITPAARVYVKLERTPKAPTPPRAPQRVYQRGFSTMQAMRAPERASTLASCAQLHLQRYFPVYRAKIQFRNAPDDAWIVAGRRISEAEMIQIAQRKGFEVAA